MNAVITHTLVISGDTYKAREKLKDMGFAWDADSKSWSVGIQVDGDMIHSQKFYNTTLASTIATVRCYAKSDKIIASVEAL